MRPVPGLSKVAVAHPGQAPSVLIRIRGAVPNLRPAEQRVAAAVLDDPAAISESSITAVARLCQTSETTVLRFCRAIGFGGYPELRIALARAAQFEESDSGASPLSGTIDPSDTLSDIVAKIAHADARAVEDTASTLNLAVLKAAVETLVEARRIDIYGVGSSALVGQDFHRKLHRIGLVSFMWPEGHLALTSSALLGPGDVAVGLSHTGRTIGVIDGLRSARGRGATTVAVTNYDKAPIAAAADLVLVTAARETTFRSGSMASRIAQLALLDFLFVAVAQRAQRKVVTSAQDALA